MKKFNFFYSTLVWILLVLVALFSIGGLIFNVFNIIEYASMGAFKVVTYSLLIILIAFLLVLDISVMFGGCYKIKNGKLYMCFGIIPSTIDLKNVVEIIHFKKSDKLVMYFSDKKYSVVIISPALYDDFVLAVREINPKILFDNKIDGEDTPD